MPITQPKFRKLRNFSLIYRESLLQALEINQNMLKVFHSSDPNVIAEIIMTTLNEIVDTLAPLRIIPIKKDHIPYIDTELRREIKFNKVQLTEAISSKTDKNKWRDYRKKRNKISKDILKKKSIFIKNKLSQPINKWKFVKTMNSGQASSSPSYID